MPLNEHNRVAPFLALDNLVKRYGAHTAVDGISLDIQRGEFISLLGPSGCGKTTILHMIAGFLEPDAGDIVLGGVSLTNIPSHKRGTAMVFQNYALFPHMTVFDNIAFGLRMRKLDHADIARRVAEILALVQLSALGKRYPRELSGGQQQRVALARAVVLQPQLLLLDEPLSNLDAKLRRELRQDFVAIHRATGMTTILVTHDLEEAFATSDRVAVLGLGKLQQFDTPRGIYTRPKTQFVSDFVGHGNVLEGLVQRHAGGHRMMLAGMQIEVPAPQSKETAGAGANANAARYAIPAHTLEISQLQNRGDAHRARLLKLQYLGATVRFELDLRGTLLTGERAAGTWTDALEVGSEVSVFWPVPGMIALPRQAA